MISTLDLFGTLLRIGLSLAVALAPTDPTGHGPSGDPKSMGDTPSLLLAKLAQAVHAAEQTLSFGDRKAFIIQLRDEPLATYDGRIPGLEATSLRASPHNQRRGKLNTQSQASRRYMNYLEQKHRAFLRILEQSLPRVQVLHHYHIVLNGLVALVPPSDIPALVSHPEVKALLPVVEYELAAEPIAPLVLDVSNDLMGVPAVWEMLGGRENAGRGVKIGILDTGVDFSNPMFHDPDVHPPQGFPRGDLTLATSKVIVAKVIRSIFDETDPRLDPGHRTAQDLVGHGSHVASCAAGASVSLRGIPGARPVTLSGVAPKAYIGSYRIFAPRAFTDNIVAAIEEAVQDGMDILNMSFGPRTPPTSDPAFNAQVIAVNNAAQAGVLSVIAAGNKGVSPPFNSAGGTIGGAAESSEALTVGASTNGHVSDGVARALLRVDAEDLEISGIRGANGAAPFPARLVGPLLDVDLMDGEAPGLLCDPLPAGVLKDALALVQRGQCTFYTKVVNAAQAGAIAVVIYNSPEGGDAPFRMDLQGAPLPALSITRSEGLRLKALLARDHARNQITRASVHLQEPRTFPDTPNFLASFSSRGPSNDYQIKPDLVTVGTGSYAAVQDDDPRGENRFPTSPPDIGQSTLYDPSGFAFSQGTSFSAPRAAGAAALLRQLHPDWTPAEIKSALVTTATRPPEMAGLSVLDRGAGLLNLPAAVRLQTLALPASLSFGRQVLIGPILTGPTTFERSFRLTNKSSVPTEYRLRAVLASGAPFARVTLSAITLRLLPGESTTVTVSLEVMSLPPLGMTDIEGDILIADGDRTIPGEMAIPFWIRLTRLQ